MCDVTLVWRLIDDNLPVSAMTSLTVERSDGMQVVPKGGAPASSSSAGPAGESADRCLPWADDPDEALYPLHVALCMRSWSWGDRGDDRGLKFRCPLLG